MSTSPVSAPEKKNNLLWWVLGLLCAGVVILGLSALVAVTYFAKNARIKQTTTQVEISTPGGQLKVSTDATKDTGLPVYPGATVLKSGGNLEFITPEDERVGVAAARFRTSDPLEKVDAWYRDRLGADFRREGLGTKAHTIHVRGLSVGSETIAFVSEQDELVRVVAIKKKGTGAEIELARVGKQEAQ